MRGVERHGHSVLSGSVLHDMCMVQQQQQQQEQQQRDCRGPKGLRPAAWSWVCRCPPAMEHVLQLPQQHMHSPTQQTAKQALGHMKARCRLTAQSLDLAAQVADRVVLGAAAASATLSS